jgi:hypothetical protein
MKLAFAVVALLIPGSADAASSLTMTCENPRQEYRVQFNKLLNTLKAGRTDYRVLAVEETNDRLVVVGLTVNDGPTFRAHFRPYKKMELFSNNQLFQADACR